MTVAEESLTVQNSTQNGHDVTTHFTQMSFDGATLPLGSQFLNDGDVVLIVRATTSRIMTVVGQRKNQHGFKTNTVVTMGTGTHVVGPFSTHHFNDAYGYTHVTFNGTSATDVVLALHKGVVKE